VPVDTRFFASSGAVTLGEWAQLAGAVLENGDPETEMTGVAASTSCGPGDVCFFEGRAEDACDVNAQAGACLVRAELAGHLDPAIPALVCERPRLVHARVSASLFPLRPVFAQGQAISPHASIHETAAISHGAVVCDGAAIGEGTVIGPGTCVGPGVQIGRFCEIGPQVTLQCALVGDQVSLGPGVRIGQAGFGVIGSEQGAEELPQLGRVILQDHVSIGANTTVDRGAFDDTIIGERTKIDNLCHIAHNVVIGRNVVIAGYTGISGSCWIGDGVRMGGRVGMVDHVRVGAGASLASGSGAFRDIPDGETWGGTPAKPLRDYLREVAWVTKQTRARNKS
jgi:UDP-3-O-[3-hydroxymyristoyl] glucosamine N-acyltransferase